MAEVTGQFGALVVAYISCVSYTQDMTTTQSIETLAASLFQLAIRSEARLAINGGGDTSQFALDLVETTRENLRDFLDIHAGDLDADWATIRADVDTSASWRAARNAAY